MDTKPVWASADVAKDFFEGNLVYEGATRKFPMSPAGAAAFYMWCQTLPGFDGHIAVEATGIYSRQLALWLMALGAKVAIINPGHIHAYGRSFGRRNKTDKIDARLINRFANERTLRLWEPADPACDTLKALLEQRETAKLELDRLKKQLSAMKTAHKLFTQRVKATETYIKKLEKAIRDHERANAELKENVQILRSIPGVGEWTARAILAYTNNLKDFTRRSLASYTGLAPCVYHSGTYTGGGHIPHTGPWLIKKYLYMAAQANTQSRMDNPLADFYKRLRSNHKSGKQALCALMRKMILTARALVKSKATYYPVKHMEALVEN